MIRLVFHGANVLLSCKSEYFFLREVFASANISKKLIERHKETRNLLLYKLRTFAVANTSLAEKIEKMHNTVYILMIIRNSLLHCLNKLR